MGGQIIANYNCLFLNLGITLYFNVALQQGVTYNFPIPNEILPQHQIEEIVSIPNNGTALIAIDTSGKMLILPTQQINVGDSFRVNFFTFKK